MRLSPQMRERLEAVANFVVTNPAWPLPSYWHSSSTDRALVRRGLIERVNHTVQMRGSIGFTAHLCKVTDAGRTALARIEGENDGE